MDALLADSAAQEEFWMQLLGLFAGLGVALAAIGLYGVISYAVAQRIHELGVRTALGATRTDVFTLIVRQGFVLALLGVAIGIPAAVALTRVIASRLFGVTATDPATLAAAAVMFVSIALLACSIPARRATKIDRWWPCGLSRKGHSAQAEGLGSPLRSPPPPHALPRDGHIASNLSVTQTGHVPQPESHDQYGEIETQPRPGGVQAQSRLVAPVLVSSAAYTAPSFQPIPASGHSRNLRFGPPLRP